MMSADGGTGQRIFQFTRLRADTFVNLQKSMSAWRVEWFAKEY
jgi:hypothetical protein